MVIGGGLNAPRLKSDKSRGGCFVPPSWRWQRRNVISAGRSGYQFFMNFVWSVFWLEPFGVPVLQRSKVGLLVPGER
jgi:hypothetical protein